jgi:hypothetical protein
LSIDPDLPKKAADLRKIFASFPHPWFF